MSDISYTGANVVPTATGANEFMDVVWGEAVTGGMPVYQHTDGKFYKAIDDTALHAAAIGFVCSAGGASQRGQIQTAGRITLAGMTTGITYSVSDNAGGIRPVSDQGSGDFVTILGVAISATVLQIGIIRSGIAQ